MGKIFIKALVIFMCIEVISCTLLSGMMFQYLLGNYVARQVFPNILGATFQALAPPPNGVTVSGGPLSGLSSMVRVATALGANRRVNRYMKDFITESKKTRMSDSSEELQDMLGVGAKAPDDEEAEEFRIKYDKDTVDMAEEELAEESPLNYFYALQDKRRRDPSYPNSPPTLPSLPHSDKNKGNRKSPFSFFRSGISDEDETQQDLQDASISSVEGPPAPAIPKDPPVPQEIPTPSKNSQPIFGRFKFPLFFRYKKSAREPRIRIRFHNPFVNFG